MITHYLKIAFRNQWKYKTQSTISVLGLAVGFTCFALSALWIRYEMTYDSFNKNVNDIYLITRPSSLDASGRGTQIPSPFPEYLKELFPEVKEAININSRNGLIWADSAYLEMFDVKFLEGSLDFRDPNKNELAITRKKAEELFGQENPVGKVYKSYGAEYTVTGIIDGYSDHSNFPIDILLPINRSSYWNATSNDGLVQLYPNVDAEAFRQKIYNYEFNPKNSVSSTSWTHTSLIPLSKMQYENPKGSSGVKFQYILVFVLASILVILCSLFNYLTLFVSRFRIRGKEIALRMLCGASNTSIYKLLSVEFLLSLILAFLLSMVFTRLVIKPFQELSEISTSVSDIYLEFALYTGLIILISQLVFLIVLTMFRKRSLAGSIQRSQKSFFRKASIIIQLVISIGFVFCTVVMLKQVHHLHTNTSAGFDFRNRGALTVWGEVSEEALADKIAQIPEITETLRGFQPILPVFGRQGSTQSVWEGKTDDQESLFIEQFFISPKYFDFYGLQLKEGELPEEGDSEEVWLINESAAKAFGWDDPVGKHIEAMIVKGVIRNIYNFSPVLETKPVYYNQVKRKTSGAPNVLFKYRDGSWKTVQTKVRVLVEKEYPDLPESALSLSNTEEEYAKFFKSEEALITMLNFMSVVCVIISIFGFLSMVALNLEERKKGMAVRKVNGATVGDILSVYFKEYLALVLVGSLIAFPVGYRIMKHWLEQYVNQTSIGFHIYLLILLGIVTVLILCVGWRVVKAVRENPAEVLKGES